MSVALIISGISLALFVVFARIFTLEERAGKRFFLSYWRRALDHMLVSLKTKLHKSLVYLGKYIITLSWYYSLHAFLQVVLKFIAGLYYVVENILHKNRVKAIKIRKDKKRDARSHLEIIADHKEDNKLTEQQKKRLKEKTLAGD